MLGWPIGLHRTLKLEHGRVGAKTANRHFQQSFRCRQISSHPRSEASGRRTRSHSERHTDTEVSSKSACQRVYRSRAAANRLPFEIGCRWTHQVVLVTVAPRPLTTSILS